MVKDNTRNAVRRSFYPPLYFLESELNLVFCAKLRLEALSIVSKMLLIEYCSFLARRKSFDELLSSFTFESFRDWASREPNLAEKIDEGLAMVGIRLY